MGMENGSAIGSDINNIRYFCGLVREVKGETFSMEKNHLNFTRYQPYGVVLKINPFNHPFRFCVEKIAAPLLMGNSLIIKNSEQAPISSLRFCELLDDIFPKGLINVVTGGPENGKFLVEHPDIKRIAVIGSVNTGIAIAKSAAPLLKNISLELGGKNPIIVFDDADADFAAGLAIKGMNLSRQGQSCSSTSRVLVNKKVASGMKPGTHGSTFGGNPLAMSAGNAVMDVMFKKGFLNNVSKNGKYFINQLDKIKNKYPRVIKEVRGKGLLIGLCLHVNQAKFIQKLLDLSLIHI